MMSKKPYKYERYNYPEENKHEIWDWIYNEVTQAYVTAISADKVPVRGLSSPEDDDFIASRLNITLADRRTISIDVRDFVV